MSVKASVIMPAYNCEKFIDAAIQSVISQTYENWELVIVDDCSTDSTYSIACSYAEKDGRIVCLKNDVNSGAARSRNAAVEKATGNYMAFLDSDDVWYPEKLEKQIAFMQENGYDFTCTAYTKIDTSGNDLHIKKIAQNVDYDGLLKHAPGNSTVIYNSDSLGKFYIPLIRKRNDYVMWLQVIKKAGRLYGLDEILACHRIGQESLSSNKFSLLKYQWEVYHKIEKLSFFKSLYLTGYCVFKKIFNIQ